jgi:DNA-binding MarR family transcriptional regulator
VPLDQQRGGAARGLASEGSVDAGITATDLDALEHLEADGPLTQRQLGDRLSLTSGAITNLVDRLERAGWVRRRPHPTDRRYLLLELSPKVAQLAPDGLQRYHGAIDTLAGHVPDKDREAIMSFLEAAAEAAGTAADQLTGDRDRPPGITER